MLSERTLVVVFLRGGADTLNLLIPSGDEDYLRHRPTLGLRRGTAGAIALTDFYSVHPELAPLLPAWKEGRLAFAQAVGVDDSSGSHFEVQDRLEQGAGAAQSLSGGWAGRALRLLGGGPLAGLAVGERIPKALRGAPALTSFNSLSELALPKAEGLSGALRALYAGDSSVLGQRAGDTLSTLERLSALQGTVRRPPRDYPEGAFGRALADLATVLRAQLGVRVACVELSSWDTHFVQPALFAGLVRQLAGGLAAFEADLGPVQEKVTVVVVTEFGRRLYENASGGTDHGRAFSALVLGQVNGGVHGVWPGFESELLPGPGGLTMTTDVRVLLRDALVASFGEAVGQVFPGLEASTTGVFRG